MNAELPTTLLSAALANSAAILLVLALRRPLRRLAGPQVACLAWLLVPLATLAACLPALPASGVLAGVEVAPLRTAAAMAGVQASNAGWGMPVLGLWLAGVLATAALFVLRQRRLPADLGPAVIGLLRPRILLPADFARRYSAEERALVLAHEQEHLRRRDLPVQAAFAALRCLFWFNPLAHLAAACLRVDQELACDAAVLARHPGARRRYGEALLKTELAGFGIPVGCPWLSGHPLKERLAMLKRPLPAPRRRRTGLGLVALLAAATSLAAWAGGDVDAMPSPQGELAPPVYPASALEAELSGRVVLHVLVATDGSVKDARVVNSEPAGVFDQAALAAVRQWQFNPGSKDGQAIEAWVEVPVDFRADGMPPETAN